MTLTTKKLFRDLLVFLLGLFFLTTAIHACLLRGWQHQSVSQAGTLNRLVRGELPAEILILGSSRAWVHFDCTAVEARTEKSCFNLGLDGSTLLMQNAVFQSYLAHHAAPSVLVLALDISSFTKTDDRYWIERYLPHLNQYPILKVLADLDPVYWRHRLIPLYTAGVFGAEYAEKGMLLFFQPQDFPGKERQGFRAVERDWDEAAAHAVIKRLPVGPDFVDAKALAAFDSILKTAHRSGARVFVVYPPAHESVARRVTNQNEILNFFHEAARVRGAQFLDYSASFLIHDKAYFYNPQHLNRQGAELFSDRFSEDLAAILKDQR